jgi:hypothetical protein
LLVALPDGNRACMSSALPTQPNARNMKLGACPGGVDCCDFHTAWR